MTSIIIVWPGRASDIGRAASGKEGWEVEGWGERGTGDNDDDDDDAGDDDDDDDDGDDDDEKKEQGTSGSTLSKSQVTQTHNQFLLLNMEEEVLNLSYHSDNPNCSNN